MAKKGQAKNTKNKSKHTKLMERKKNKIRKDKDANKEKLKEIMKRYQNSLKENEIDKS